jgi:hypothetical protein
MKEIEIAALTALFGVVTFVIGQITVKLFEPAYDLRAHFGAIARDLLVYANRDPNIATDQDRLKAFRILAAVTHEKLYRVAWYWLFRIVLGLPPRTDVVQAASLLIGLSNAQVADRRRFDTGEPAPETVEFRDMAACFSMLFGWLTRRGNYKAPAIKDTAARPAQANKSIGKFNFQTTAASGRINALVP